jgi:hypothetical protein
LLRILAIIQVEFLCEEEAKKGVEGRFAFRETPFIRLPELNKFTDRESVAVPSKAPSPGVLVTHAGM